MTTTNATAGRGPYFHEVPTVELLTVHIADAHHSGTLVTLYDEEYVFSSLDDRAVTTTSRCVLVRIWSNDERGDADHDWWLQEIPAGATYGCDLDTPSGLLLVGCADGDELSALGESLWDSSDLMSE